MSRAGAPGEAAVLIVLFQVMAIALGVLLALLAGFLIHVMIKYTPIIDRIFLEKPVLLPPRVDPEPGGEDVRFASRDGLTLAGTYYPARTLERSGVIVFCPEFLADRFSMLAYIGQLRDWGFDLFTFDVRNHGESDIDRSYDPLQWVTDREVSDLAAALDYLQSRPDYDPAGVGLFGISKGGNAALCLAHSDPRVWAVISDGAFPTRGTVYSYTHRWAEIYVGHHVVWQNMPAWFFDFLVRMLVGSSRIWSQRRMGVRFPDVEAAVTHLSPRPWLLIHGEDDTYIGPEIVNAFFARAKEPKDLWIVPGAKHNRCREVDPAAYTARILAFLEKWAPRRPAAAPVAAPEQAAAEPEPVPEAVVSARRSPES